MSVVNLQATRRPDISAHDPWWDDRAVRNEQLGGRVICDAHQLYHSLKVDAQVYACVCMHLFLDLSWGNPDALSAAPEIKLSIERFEDVPVIYPCREHVYAVLRTIAWPKTMLQGVRQLCLWTFTGLEVDVCP